MPFVNIFSWSVTFFFFHSLKSVSFIEQNFLMLLKSSLAIFSFMYHAFGVISKKSSLYARISRFSPVLPSRSFRVTSFTLRFLIHLANFCEGHKVCTEIHFYACGCPVLTTSFAEKTTSTLLYCLCFFVKYQLIIFMRVYF